MNLDFRFCCPWPWRIDQSNSPISLSSASECDFEGGSCGWYELTHGDGFDWVRGSSDEVPPHFYGHPPPLDHTTNSTKGKETHDVCNRNVLLAPSGVRSDNQ